MKNIITIIGILFIIFGIAVFGYRGFTYKEKEKVAQIGTLQITATTEKKVSFPPILGGLSLAAGLILVVVGRIKR